MAGTDLHITVQGEKYALRFGYAALRQLGTLWGTDDLQQIFDRLAKLGEIEGGSLNMSMLDTFGDMVLAAIMAHRDNDATDLDGADVVTALMEDHSIMQDVMNAYVASLPQQKKSKPQPVKKTSKKARKKP